MKSLRDRLSIVVAACALAVTGSVTAQPAPGAPPYGMGPGMMGPGYGGMGPGMMGGPPYGAPAQQGNGGARAANPDLDSPGGRAFASSCSECHALPYPSQHTADQWPAVVARMETYMRNARMPSPDESRTKEIDNFLEQHASPKK